MMATLGDTDMATRCSAAADKARVVVPDANGSKAAVSLQVLAGMREPKKAAAEMLESGGPTGLSTFLGLYVLEALGKAGETDAGLNFVRTYWGAMIDRGATTFWEDFDLSWLGNSGRIDELTPPGKKDLHGDFGSYGYTGFRKSLCHGWAGGPTAWLSEYVLGVRPLEPGCTKIVVSPHLGDLRWVEGTYPTPQGPIKVRHERQADGSVKSNIDAPTGVTVVRGEAGAPRYGP